MNYTDLEENLVTRIAAKIPQGVEVMALPETDPEVSFPSTSGKITVAYLSSDFGPSESTDIVTQPETITFELVIQSRKLRGTIGIYTLLTGIKTALLGWCPSTTAKIQFSRSTYVTHDNGVWTYKLNLTTMNMAIEEPDSEDDVIARKLTAATTNYENIVVESQVP